MYIHRTILEVKRILAGEKSTVNSFNSVYFLRGQDQINVAATSKKLFMFYGSFYASIVQFSVNLKYGCLVSIMTMHFKNLIVL